MFCPKAAAILSAFQDTLKARAKNDGIDANKKIAPQLDVHPFGSLLRSLIPGFEMISRAPEMDA